MKARRQTKTTVIVIETDPEKRVPGYESWWDVPVAEVSESEDVQARYEEYVPARAKEKYYL